MRNSLKQTQRLHGIIMQEESIHGLEAELKTNTRRLIKQEQIMAAPDRFRFVGDSTRIEIPRKAITYDERVYYQFELTNSNAQSWVLHCPYGKIGDILWVREAWNYSDPMLATSADSGGEANGKYVYKASTKDAHEYRWKSSMYMPKVACRYFLQITDILIERLQDISEGEAIREGVMEAADRPGSHKVYWKHYGCKNSWVDSPVKSYQTLFETINGKGSWLVNPWVWVISFKQIPRPALLTPFFI